MVRHVQNVHSHEMEIMQVTDFLTGALAYRHRSLSSNSAKVAVLEHLEKKLGRSLLSSTSLAEQKLNVFLSTPRGV